MFADGWQNLTAHPILEWFSLGFIASHDKTIEILFVDEIDHLLTSVGRDFDLT
jgi:hypothetical protein